MAPMAPAAWISELAEELSLYSASGDVVTVTRRLREEATNPAHPMDRWLLTQQIAAEWHRLGIISVPAQVPLSLIR